MKRKIVNGILLMALVVSSVSSFVSCKDYDEDIYVDLRSRVDKQATLQEALQQQINELKTLIASIEKCECAQKNYLTEEKAILLYLSKDEAYKNYYTKAEIDALLQAHGGGDIADCSARLAAAETAIKQLQTLYEALKSRLAQVDINTTNIAELAAQISKMNADLLSVKAIAEQALELAQKAGSAETLADLVTRVATLEGLVAGWDERLTEVNKTAIEALAKANTDYDLIKANRTSIDSLAAILKTLEGVDATKFAELETRLKEIEDDYVKSGDLETLRVQLEASVKAAQMLAEMAMALAQADSVRIDNLEGSVGCIDCIISRIADLETYVYSLTPGTPGSSYDDTELRGYITKLQSDLDALQKALNGDDATATKGLIDRVGDLETKVKDFVTKEDFNKALIAVNKRVDSLATVTAAIEEDIKDLKTDIDAMITSIIIQGAKSPVIGYFAAPVDVRSTILAVYFGEAEKDYEFPTVKSGNYLDASDADRWTSRNLQAIGVSNLNKVEGFISGSLGDKLVTQKDNSEIGNAGRLFVTINPSNVKFTGKTLELKDSRDNKAPVALSPLQPSEYLINFGYTRSETNGYYEAAATMTADNVDKAQLQINYNDMKDDAIAIVKERSAASVMELGNTLINNVENVLPAYAAKASWKSKATGTVHNIYSQYNVAATAIKPLSFNFLYGYSRTSMPGFDRIQDMVGTVIDKIKVTVDLGLPDMSKYEGSITFKDIKLPTIDDDMFRITYYHEYKSEELTGDGKLYGDVSDKDLFFLVTNVKDGRYALVSTSADGSEQQLWIADGSGSYHKATAAEQAAWGAIEFSLVVDVDINKTPEIKQTLQDIIDSLNKEYGADSDLAKNITNLMNDVSSLNKIETNINTMVTDTKEDLKTMMNKYITKVNNKLTKYFNRLPGMMNLAMIGTSNNKAGLLSQSKKMPTKVSGTLELVPTSYNLELLAPAYKKFVAVTDVFDSSRKNADINKAKTANTSGTNLAVVIDADKTCSMTGEAGYIYEITYTAIDYFGRIAFRRYYVRF